MSTISPGLEAPRLQGQASSWRKSVLHGLYQHVTSPTQGSNMLDLVISNFTSPVDTSILPPVGNSDHSSVLAGFSIPIFREPKTARRVWRYQHADWPRLRHFYSTTDWETLISPSADTSCSRVTDHILGMHKFIPSKVLSTRPSDPQWWTPECTESVKAEHHAWKQWRTLNNDSSHARYTRSCTTAKNCQLHAKSSYQSHLRGRLTSGNLQAKQWWSAVKRAAGDKRGSDIPTLRNSNCELLITNREKAEAFGKFFSEKCSLGASELTSESIPDVQTRSTEKIQNIHFPTTTVFHTLKRLDTSKASGPDGISAHVLKACASQLALPLSRLFSLCFRSGIQPSSWKVANVVPIHKKKSRSTLSNYRSISLLTILSKVMETHVNRSVTNFLERNSIRSHCQFGFHGSSSTADLLTKLHHEWSKSLASGVAVHVLAIDIAGAFDKVSHPGVLHKAKCYGIRGPLLTWPRRYLENRQIKAVVGGQSSTPHNIRAGVPQESILGPTLFLLYVNGCQDILPPGIGLGTYADDTTLYQSISTTTDIPDASEALQQATDAISHWGSTWRIAFEPTKSKALQIDHHRPPSGLPAIRFNGFDVPEADQIKLLGVVFDRQLRLTATFAQQLYAQTADCTSSESVPRYSLHMAEPPSTRPLSAQY